MTGLSSASAVTSKITPISASLAPVHNNKLKIESKTSKYHPLSTIHTGLKNQAIPFTVSENIDLYSYGKIISWLWL
jgi:hypothetical protein